MSSNRTVDQLSFEQVSAFLGVVRAGDSLVRALNRSLEDNAGLSLHEFEVLLFLARSVDCGVMQMSDLRQRTPLSQSRVSRVVSGLERQGLVTRSKSNEDSRAVDVAITSEGRTAFAEAEGGHVENLDARLFAILTDDEIVQLATISRKILDANRDD